MFVLTSYYGMPDEAAVCAVQNCFCALFLFNSAHWFMLPFLLRNTSLASQVAITYKSVGKACLSLAQKRQHDCHPRINYSSRYGLPKHCGLLQIVLGESCFWWLRLCWRQTGGATCLNEASNSDFERPEILIFFQGCIISEVWRHNLNWCCVLVCMCENVTLIRLLWASIPRTVACAEGF